MGAHRTRVYLEDMCGPLLGLALEYLDGYAKRHYKSLGHIRTTIGTFFLFMNEKGITDLESITPKVISEFLDWADDLEYANAAHDISILNGFFKWAVCHGHRRAPSSPVETKFHGMKRPKYLPKPYKTEEMALIWRFAEERGSGQLRAALAIGQESGLRIGEICNLRVQDVNLQGLWLFVRLPNKTDTERRAKFTDRAAQYITAWLEERNGSCGHDHLFYNTLGDPLRPETLHAEFCRTMCKVYGGTLIHEDGLDRWSTHRLRHTMASNLVSGGASVAVVMEAGGWKSPASMLGYTQIDAELARRGYNEAMARAYEREKTRAVHETLSPEAFLALYGADAEL
jgi:integrase/recombinase XerC